MNSAQIRKNRKPAAPSAQIKKSSAPNDDQDERLAADLKKRGITFKGNAPRVLELIVFADLFEDARKWEYDSALAKLSSLAELMDGNPRMAIFRKAIEAMNDADRTLSAAMAAIREI